MTLHNVADILQATITAAAAAVATAALPNPSSASGTATIPEPIPPIPSQTHSPGRPHPLPPNPFPEGLVVHSIGRLGKITAIVVFALYAITLLGLLFSLLRRPLATRLLRMLLLLITIVGLTSYYAYATNLGWAFSFYHSSAGGPSNPIHARQVFYGRFVQWSFTTPLILLVLGNLAGLPTIRLVFLAISGVGTEVFGAIGTAVAHGPYSHAYPRYSAYGWLIFSAFSSAYALLVLLLPGRHAATARSPTTGKFYTFLALWEIILSLLYPIFILLGPFLNILPVKAHFLADSILDVLTQVVFTWVVLFGLKRHPESEVVLSDGWTTEGGGGYVYEQVGQDEHGRPVDVAVPHA